MSTSNEYLSGSSFLRSSPSSLTKSCAGESSLEYTHLHRVRRCFRRPPQLDFGFQVCAFGSLAPGWLLTMAANVVVVAMVVEATHADEAATVRDAYGPAWCPDQRVSRGLTLRAFTYGCLTEMGKSSDAVSGARFLASRHRLRRQGVA